MGRFNSRSTTITHEDGTTPTPLSITAGPGPGDFTFGNTNAENTEKIRVDDRGQYDCHIEGNDLEQEWSLTIGLRNQTLTEGAADRITDWYEKTGNFSAAVSVNANPDVWAFVTKITMVLSGVTTLFTLPNCLGNYSFAEAMEGSTLAVSGVNNGKITRTNIP